MKETDNIGPVAVPGPGRVAVCILGLGWLGLLGSGQVLSTILMIGYPLVAFYTNPVDTLILWGTIGYLADLARQRERARAGKPTHATSQAKCLSVTAWIVGLLLTAMFLDWALGLSTGFFGKW